MKLVLIRHAQSIRNVALQGSHFYEDEQEKLGLPNHFIHLTEKGKAEARDVGHTLCALEKQHGTPAVLMHSGFKRAKETALLIKEEVGLIYEGSSFSLPIEQNHLLRERDAGHAFEMSEGEAAKYFPFLQQYWGFEGKWFATPPGGESFIQVMDRVSLFLHILANNKKYEGRTVYAVSHGGTMQAFKMVIEKIPFDEADERVRNPKNCELARYEYEQGEWRPLQT
jgi:2,3-bisphosphoglycerate-dependent phosphoglycerate mutase